MVGDFDSLALGEKAMTDALAYMRCSGMSQVSGDTWDRQEAAINKYAAANDIVIVEWYRDEGVSGTTELENRPGLAACLERIENNGVKVILVESSDRLARDAMVSELIIREAQKHGGTVLTASGVNLTEGGDSNPTAALIRGVLALIAEFDKRVIVLKLRAARDRQKAKTGRCEGVKPFGHDPERPDEADTLAILLHLEKVYMDAEELADHLNEKGFPTRSGAPWRASTIRKIVKREESSNPVPEKAS